MHFRPAHCALKVGDAEIHSKSVVYERAAIEAALISQQAQPLI